VEVKDMADLIEGINLSMGTEAPSVKSANMKRKNREPPNVTAPKKLRIDQEVGSKMYLSTKNLSLPKDRADKLLPRLY
jgi:hypothetical protein